MRLNRLYELADSWDREAAELLKDIGYLQGQEEVALANYLRTCAAELRQVISEVEKENPDAPRWEIRAGYGETGDSFGECVNP